MCFIKSPKIEEVNPATVEEEKSIVKQTQADASLTKSTNKPKTSGYLDDLRTSPVGLNEPAQVQKKTLLGE